MLDKQKIINHIQPTRNVCVNQNQIFSKNFVSYTKIHLDIACFELHSLEFINDIETRCQRTLIFSIFGTKISDYENVITLIHFRLQMTSKLTIGKVIALPFLGQNIGRQSMSFVPWKLRANGSLQYKGFFLSAQKLLLILPTESVVVNVHC